MPAILNQQTVLNTNVSFSSFFFSFFLLSFFSFKLSALLSQVGSVKHKCLSFFFFLFFLSSFFLSFLVFILFFLLLEKVSKSTRSFTVDETNLFSLFPSFSEYIYNFQYLGRVEGKTVLSCTYLFRRVYFSYSFLLCTCDISPESAGSAFLLTTVQRFCSMLFTVPAGALGCRSTSLSADFCPQTENPFPNFLWRKGTIFRRLRLGQSFGLFFFFFLSISFGLLQWPTFPSLSNQLGHGVLAAFDLHSDCLSSQSSGLVSSNTEG